MIRAITPGVNVGELSTVPDANPVHTDEGMERVERLLELAGDYGTVISGFGERHVEIAQRAVDRWRPKDIPLHFCPLFGTGAVGLRNGDLLLPNGLLVQADRHISVPPSWINAGQLRRNIPDNALMCADPWVLAVLGARDCLKEGLHLYQLFDGQSARCVA